MKKRTILLFTLLNLIIVAVFTATLIYCTNLQDSLSLTVYFGESHAGTRNIAQLFYAENSKKFSKNSVLTQVFDNDVVSFEIGAIDFKENVLRLVPFNTSTDFSITKLDVTYGKYTVLSLSGEEITEYIDKVKRVKHTAKPKMIIFTGTGKSPRVILNRAFSDKLYQYYLLVNRVPYIIIGLLFLLLGVIQVRVFMPRTEEEAVGRHLFWMIISDIIIGLGIVLLYTLFYFEDHFGQVPFGQLVYHLHTPLDGTDMSSYYGVIMKGVFLTILIFSIVLCIYFLLKRKNAHRGYIGWCETLGFMLVIYASVQGCIHFDLIDYYRYTHESTNLYEEYYVDGREVVLTFPEKKRNLIYIYLESMEITFADIASGGAMQTNYIPELTDLAMQGDTFSEADVLNGAYQVSGATYTMGALAAQTSGVPINENMVSNDTLNGTWESENNYLPGIWSIGNILEKEGYNQEFLIGSDGAFAGRSSYFKGHGNYVVSDYHSAMEEERIADGYKVWWGYEDEKLFSFAKEDVTRLAGQGEPFNLTLLTVDTHATGGYVCDLCEEEYEAQYSNVLACTSRQAAEFIEWMKEQDFYDNTTIVLAGDHLYPDSYYIASEGAEGFDRKTYFAVINPADGKVHTGDKRMYTTMDIFPTTLSSLGVDIEGGRLGLGVDLYAGIPTLVEEHGLEYLNIELMKNSDYYREKLLYK